MSAIVKPVFRTEFSLDEIRRLSDFSDSFRWLYHTGIQRGETCGWPSMDPYFTIRPREWTLLSGIPSHGKSSFLDNLIVNTMYLHGWRWAVFSAENLPLERHAASLASIFIGRPFGPGLRPQMSKSDMEWAHAFIDTHIRWINPPENDSTIDRVLYIAELIAEHDGCQAVVIDPWNELDHSRPPNISETEYISRALTKVRRFAREHELHVFLVAHPTKLQRVRTAEIGGVETSVYPVPTPYDVSGSAHFRNKADNCLCVWRDVVNERSGSQVHIQKVRFREVGHVGVCQMHYDTSTGQFLDPLTGPALKPFDAHAFYGERAKGAANRQEKKAALEERRKRMVEGDLPEWEPGASDIEAL